MHVNNKAVVENRTIVKASGEETYDTTYKPLGDSKSNSKTFRSLTSHLKMDPVLRPI